MSWGYVSPASSGNEGFARDCDTRAFFEAREESEKNATLCAKRMAEIADGAPVVGYGEHGETLYGEVGGLLNNFLHTADGRDYSGFFALPTGEEVCAWRGRPCKWLPGQLSGKSRGEWEKEVQVFRALMSATGEPIQVQFATEEQQPKVPHLEGAMAAAFASLKR